MIRSMITLLFQLVILMTSLWSIRVRGLGKRSASNWLSNSVVPPVAKPRTGIPLRWHSWISRDPLSCHRESSKRQVASAKRESASGYPPTIWMFLGKSSLVSSSCFRLESRWSPGSTIWIEMFGRLPWRKWYRHGPGDDRNAYLPGRQWYRPWPVYHHGDDR